jgi:transglutaminase-like putative cysteine protease
VIYEVSHRTVYRYEQPVSISHHLLHLTPRPCPRQVTGESALEVHPAPSVRHEDTDYFGNPITFLTVQQSHKELMLHTLSFIDVKPPEPPEPSATPPWDDVVAVLDEDRSAETLDALQYRYASTHTPIDDDLKAYAQVSFRPRRPVLEAARELTHRINRDFLYDTRATTIGTPVAEVFRMRRGVCQDFAHLQLACLRSLGLAARYVSGYLLTRPADGKEKLVGADASHAWLAIWVPGHGWVDLDPTNDLIPKDEHITLAWGRDYGDVSPVQGIMFGGGAHTVSVAVDVTRLDPTALLIPAPPAAATAK